MKTSNTCSNNQDKKEVIPPIYVSEIQNIELFTELLNEKVGEYFTVKTNANNTVRIKINSVEGYRKSITLLENLKKDKTVGNIEFHSYRLKKDRPYEVYIRNLHPSTTPQEIASEVEKMGHRPVRITNVQINKRHNGTKQTIKLPLFQVQLEPKDNNKNIFEIKTLAYTVVKIEEPKPKKELPQCKKCQDYGHTRNYCSHEAKCVKCGNAHLTANCKQI